MASAPYHIVVIGMGYVGIPCAALLADVPGFRVTGVQRRSLRSAWKIDCLNAGRNPFEGDEPGLAELLERVVLEAFVQRDGAQKASGLVGALEPGQSDG